MTYSSALYETGANDLQSAQTAKYRALAEATGITPGDHVLEIGCGWGGFAEFAAREIGCKVTGLTISREQLAYGQERMQKTGLSDKVDLKFQDYRDENRPLRPDYLDRDARGGRRKVLGYLFPQGARMPKGRRAGRASRRSPSPPMSIPSIAGSRISSSVMSFRAGCFRHRTT
jgi:SAM-dependent methyltransferase